MKFTHFFNIKSFLKKGNDVDKDRAKIELFKQQYNAQMAREKIRTGAFID